MRHPIPDLHPAVQADIEMKIRYLRENRVSPLIIARFLDEVVEVFGKIQNHPKTWSFVEGSKATRKVQLFRFGMTAFYQIQSSGVPVILELSGPGQLPRWTRRTKKTS
jgi:hypothetical protein